MKGRSPAEATRLMRRGIALFLEGVAAARGAPGRAAALSGGTAARVAKAWRDELLSGYRQDPADILRPLRARSPEGLVAVRDIAFSSICAHHLLPFHGRVAIAYAPAGRITGLSRLCRLVDCLSRRLQIQEALTREIADAVQNHLAPSGAACVIEASHTCLTMRGSRRSGARIVTVAFTGAFLRNAAGRREVLAVIGGKARR